MASTDPKDWRTLNQLLDEALAVPPQNRARWIDDLPPHLEDLKPRLQTLLSNLSAEAPLDASSELEVDSDSDSESETWEREASMDPVAREELHPDPDIARPVERPAIAAEADSFSLPYGSLVSRNKLAVWATGAILAVILGAAVLAFWKARVAAAEKERAEEVKELLASIFRDADPYGAAPSEIPTVLDLLKQTRDRIDGSRPDLRVELLNVVAESLLNLQDDDTAEEVVREAVDAGRTELGENDPRTLQARLLLTQVHRRRGRTEEMRKELDALVPALRASEDGSKALAVALKQQANLAIDEGKYAEAESKAKEASEIALAFLGPGDPETSKTVMVLAVAFLNMKKPLKAIEAADWAYRHVLQSFGGNERHPTVIEVRAGFGRVLGEAGKPERAVEELSRVVSDASDVFGDSSMRVGLFSQTLATFLLDTGDLDAALGASERSRKIISQHAQPESYVLAGATRLRGISFLLARKDRPALEDLTTATKTYVKVLGPTHDATLATRAHRALALAYTGSVRAAADELENVVDAGRKSRSPATSVALRVFGSVRRMAGDAEQALRLHEGALGAIVEGPRAERERTLVLMEIGLDQVALHRNTEAAASLEEALERFGRLYKNPTPQRADALLGLGRARLGLGHPETAIEPLEEADELFRGWDPRSPSAREAALWRRRCQEALGR